MTNASRFSPSNPCRVCGGEVGTGSDGVHEVCRALARLGQPTPHRGRMCAMCDGRGHLVRGNGAAGVAIFVDDLGAFERHMDARFPRCTDCGGNGVAR